MAADVAMSEPAHSPTREHVPLALVANEPPLSVPGKKVYTIKGGHHFEVDENYQILRRLGKGSYGLIADATHRPTGESVAVKKISNALELEAKHTLREIRLLKHFNHENILGLHDVMTPPMDTGRPWNDVYLVIERMDTDLFYVLHSGQVFSQQHAQWIMYQLLRGVKAIHSAKALHRDLKPSNLLINQNCDIKICDFGLSRGFDESKSPERRRAASSDADIACAAAPMADEPAAGPAHVSLTDYVVTRWYRAPELLVQNREYGQGVDMWAVGCILAECLSREILFPGTDYLKQTRLIIEALGAPSSAVLARTVDEPAARDYIEKTGQLVTSPVPVRARMPKDSDPAALALLDALLVFDASERPSAAQALEAEWFAELKGLNPEPDAPPFDFDFEEEGVTADEIKELIYEEMCSYHPEWRDRRPSFA